LKDAGHAGNFALNADALGNEDGDDKITASQDDPLEHLAQLGMGSEPAGAVKYVQQGVGHGSMSVAASGTKLIWRRWLVDVHFAAGA
jgi:hypothetical protein